MCSCICKYVFHVSVTLVEMTSLSSFNSQMKTDKTLTSPWNFVCVTWGGHTPMFFCVHPLSVLLCSCHCLTSNAATVILSWINSVFCKLDDTFCPHCQLSHLRSEMCCDVSHRQQGSDGPTATCHRKLLWGNAQKGMTWKYEMKSFTRMPYFRDHCTVLRTVSIPSP